MCSRHWTRVLIFNISTSTHMLEDCLILFRFRMWYWSTCYDFHVVGQSPCCFWTSHRRNGYCEETWITWDNQVWIEKKVVVLSLRVSIWVVLSLRVCPSYLSLPPLNWRPKSPLTKKAWWWCDRRRSKEVRNQTKICTQISDLIVPHTIEPFFLVSFVSSVHEFWK